MFELRVFYSVFASKIFEHLPRSARINIVPCQRMHVQDEIDMAEFSSHETVINP